jgi:hypothetical protein
VGFNLTDQGKEAFNEVCMNSVEILKSKDHKSRVGKSNGDPYPVVQKGIWRAALLLDTGLGWTCPYFEHVKSPHWDWFLTPTMEMTNVALMSGLPWGLLFDLESPKLIAATLEFLISDPCRIPWASCSANFLCPRCESDWETKVEEIGIVGRSFNLEWVVEPTENTGDPDGWNWDIVTRLFDGEKFGEVFADEV